MKIGILIDYAIAGGLQTAALQEAKSFQKLGHHPTLIVLTKTNSSSKFLSHTKDIPVLFIHNRSFKLSLFNFFSTAHIFAPLIAPFILPKFDYLISHNSTTTLTALTLKTPYTTIIHDPLPYTLRKVYSNYLSFLVPLVTFIEQLTINHATKVVIDSPLHAHFMSTTYHIRPTIVPLGVTPPLKPLTHLGSHLLATSRWQQAKHPEKLLDLLLKLPKSKLIIAGTWTKDLAWFKQKVSTLNLSARVKLVPSFQESDRPKLFKQARVWIHPNLEAFGLDCLLAASYGIPVIMPSGSGATTILNQGLTPKLLKKILSNHQFALKLGRLAYKAVKNNYSWDTHTQKLLP